MVIKNQKPKDCQTALDCAIRDFEKKKGNVEFGYVMNKFDIKYDNYMSNEAWQRYVDDMLPEHRSQYESGSGGELKEGTYPPNMASFGSSSRMIYELSKNIQGFEFEKQLETKVGKEANIDGYLKVGDTFIYMEAKRREIYGSKNKKISDKYKRVYSSINKKYSSFEYDGSLFKIDKKPIRHFDMKQLICHFLGITYYLIENSVDNAKVKFLYLLYNPEEVEKKYIEDKYRVKVMSTYNKVVEFIDKNKDTFKEIFKAVLYFQQHENKQKSSSSTQGDFEIKPDFEFKRVDQNSYKKELEPYITHN
ncbi:MAG: hypothetical protein J6Y72_08195 [Bacteroidales bacterium]|nr:hypothetical protein [Bacteroidales bacterium]